MQVVLSFVFNILSALFSVLSMALMIPVLEIIFQQDSEVTTLLPWAIDNHVIVNNFYYYVTLADLYQYTIKCSACHPKGEEAGVSKDVKSL